MRVMLNVRSNSSFTLFYDREDGKRHSLKILSGNEYSFTDKDVELNKRFFDFALRDKVLIKISETTDVEQVEKEESTKASTKEEEKDSSSVEVKQEVVTVQKKRGRRKVNA